MVRAPAAADADGVASGSVSPVRPDERFRLVMVEDNPDYAMVVKDMIAEAWPASPAFEHYGRLEEACARLRAGDADCVLLDLSLPDANALEALKGVRAVAPDVPIVILSGLEDELLALDAVKAGAQDYLLKSHADGQLLRRAVRHAVERKRAEVDLTRAILRDPLTELPSRGLFMDRLVHALALAGRTGDIVGVLILDVDGFSRLNRALGSEAGDYVLREVARRLADAVRPSDTVARFGADEFVVLCPAIGSEEEALGIADRLRERVGDPLPVAGRTITPTVTAGIAFGRGTRTPPEQLVRNADLSVYRAKENGLGYAVVGEEGTLIMTARGRS
jgi:diguanylate cyclase (GGDEF)-like protein